MARGEKKLVGTVKIVRFSPTTSPLRSLTALMTNDATYGRLELSSISCLQPFHPLTETATKQSLKR